MLFTILERCTVVNRCPYPGSPGHDSFFCRDSRLSLPATLKARVESLGIMNDFGMQPSNSSLQEIARAYAIVAVERAATAKAGQPKSRKASKAPQDDISSRRARSAYGIVKDLDDTPVPLLSLVSKACASAGRSLKHSHCFVGYTSRYSSKRQPISLLKRNLL
jgi:hypothetical protein